MRTESVERWKTISRRDPEFLAHLDGSFSSAFRALPVRSLNVDTVSELVTFEIVPVSEIRAPGYVSIVWQLMRPQSLVLSMGPMMTTLFDCLVRGLGVNFGVALSSSCGVLFFHIAANLFNDYGDHIKGQDRLRASGGSRAIQNGWIAAARVRRAAWVLMGAAAVCGLPAIFLHLSPVAIVAGLAGLAGLEMAFQRLRLKSRGWSELMAFALTGPLLTSGFAWAISGQVGLDAVVLGCVFGAITLLYFHSANFENIMNDSQAGVRTWATRAGFDASKRFFIFVALVVFVSACVFVIQFQPRLQLFLVLVFLAAHLVFLCRRVARLASPLSSELVGLRWMVITLAWFATALLTVSLAAGLGTSF